jgi:hypothetical protein
METPDTPRGRETERLMLLWRKQNPGADASAYNREWESVYRKLEGYIEPRYTVTGAEFKPVVIDANSSSSKTLRSRESERAAKRRAGTKGAFGKPKHLKRR